MGVWYIVGDIEVVRGVGVWYVVGDRGGMWCGGVVVGAVYTEVSSLQGV